jgi:hypothetical protein
MKINVIYCDNRRTMIPCGHLTLEWVRAKLAELNAQAEVYKAWMTHVKL